MIIQKLKSMLVLTLSLGLTLESAGALSWAQSSGAATARATLDSLSVDKDHVQLALSSPTKYAAFVTANPPRLVMELFNTDFHLPSKIWEGKGLYLKRVRSGQFKGDPHPITRVVLDLSRKADYAVTPNGNFINISLKSASPLLARRESAARNVVLRTRGTWRDNAPGAEENDPAQDQAEPRSGGPALNDAPAALSPAPSGLTAVRRRRRDILATLPREPISVDFDNTDINDVLRLLANKTNLNIVTGPDVAGTLTLHLAKVPFNEAFNLILSMQGLVANQSGENVLRVMTPATLDKERQSSVGTTRVFQLNYSKAADAKLALDAVRAAEKRTGSTVVDDKNNALIVTDSPEGQAAVERLLAQIDVRPRQVLIESKLVEVKLNKELDLGIQWDYFSLDSGKAFGKQGLTAVGSQIAPTGAFTLPLNQNILSTPGLIAGQSDTGAGGRGTGVLLPADKIFGALTLGRITNNYILSATLSAAAASGKAKVLSDPKIATMNGKMATINITTQIPYVTSNVASTGVQTQTVSYVQTGIQLSVTPLINADGRITLHVMPNVTQPSSIAASAGTTGAIATDTRQAETNILVKDGETIVIGGLITDAMSDTVAKVPLLGDIPVLGWLFKKKTSIRNRVELLIFVTTRIMPD